MIFIFIEGFGDYLDYPLNLKFPIYISRAN